jgi:ABC-2 type transport system ATP-binding protein
MILNVKDIYKSYGKETVLKGISFEIAKPDIFALVGPNGSGKSTLLNIISNLVGMDSGKVTILGKQNSNSEIFKEMSFMQDNTVLYEYLTGYDHLQFIAELHSIPKEQILQTSQTIGNDGYLHKKVKHYSLGMKQHLLLAMGIINKPKLLILDEPLNGLDPTSAIKVRELLLRLANEGTTILLSSHNLGEIDQVTPNIFFLKKGELIKEEISSHQKTFYTLEVQDVEKAVRTLLSNNLNATVMGHRIKFQLNNSQPLHLVIKILAENGVEVHDIEKQLMGAEDRYREIFSTKDDQYENDA